MARKRGALYKVGLALDLRGFEQVKSISKQQRLLLKSVKAGAKLVAPAAKARAPRRKGGGGGGLRQSIGIKSVMGTRSKRKATALAVVGARRKVVKFVKPPRGKKKVKHVPANISMLVELGTKPHALKKGIRKASEAAKAAAKKNHPGATAKPFLGPAWAATKTKAMATSRETFAAELQKEIKKIAARLAKKRAGKPRRK